MDQLAQGLRIQLQRKRSRLKARGNVAGAK
jgi:hypothetical protein